MAHADVPVIDHRGDCTALPCTCGARARVWAKRNAELKAGQVIQDMILADRLGIAGDEDE